MTTLAPDPAHALTPSGNLRRRQLVSRIMQGGAIAAAALAVAVLVVLVGFTVVKGVKAISWHFLTGSLSASTYTSGGIGPALAGTIEMTLMAAVISGFIGILTALFLTEFASTRAAVPVRTVLDMLVGLPTIIAGIFVYRLIVTSYGDSGLAGSIALSLVMTPLIARGTLESLRRVPGTWREAADALGVSRWRTVITVVLPGASSGIATATILAIARGAGETAPLLFTTSIYGTGLQLNPLHAMPSMPLQIFTLMETGYPAAVQDAWGAAFLLMITILLVNIGARMWLRRGERKRGI